MLQVAESLINQLSATSIVETNILDLVFPNLVLALSLSKYDISFITAIIQPVMNLYS
jgi:hypothetical protein